MNDLQLTRIVATAEELARYVGCTPDMIHKACRKDLLIYEHWKVVRYHEEDIADENLLRECVGTE